MAVESWALFPPEVAPLGAASCSEASKLANSSSIRFSRLVRLDSRACAVFSPLPKGDQLVGELITSIKVRLIYAPQPHKTFPGFKPACGGLQTGWEIKTTRDESTNSLKPKTRISGR